MRRRAERVFSPILEAAQEDQRAATMEVTFERASGVATAD